MALWVIMVNVQRSKAVKLFLYLYFHCDFIFRINNDLVIHKQVKISDIISRRFGDFMTPLSRVEMRLKLMMRVQELQLIFIVEVVTQIL